jgi:protein-tyrosine-phosphatase
MRLLFGKSRKEPKVKRQQEKTVLFVCVENAGRSQMAEALFRNMQQEVILLSVGEQDPQEKSTL